MTKAAGTLIYIVDDDDAVRDSLRLLLEAHGMSVEGFGSTADFATAYRQHPRACLILDLHLPVMGGLDFLASRAKDGLGLPVIIVTGRADEATRERAFELGAVAYLEKPVDDRDLLSAIDGAIDA
ncbi:MAG TPA: response regulator [Stellaceae bacterium]|nr:response regulator [Stellaceae bacterium]